MKPRWPAPRSACGPIVQGRAVSLLFGAGVATVLAVLVIPLGCISARKQFYLEETENGEIELSGRFDEIEGVVGEHTPAAPNAGGMPLWMRAWSTLLTVGIWSFRIVRAILLLLWQPLSSLLGKLRKPATPPPPPPPGSAGGGTTGAPPSSGGSPPGAGGGPQEPTPSYGAASQASAGSVSPVVTAPTDPVVEPTAAKPATPKPRPAPHKKPVAAAGAVTKKSPETAKAKAAGGNRKTGTTKKKVPAVRKKSTAARVSTTRSNKATAAPKAAAVQAVDRKPVDPAKENMRSNTDNAENSARAGAQGKPAGRTRKRPTRLGIRLKKGDNL